MQKLKGRRGEAMKRGTLGGSAASSPSYRPKMTAEIYFIAQLESIWDLLVFRMHSQG